MKTKINLLWVMIWFVGGATLMMQVPEQVLIDKVITSVDDQPIFYTDVEAEYQLYQEQGKKREKPSKLQILENIKVNKILLANAAKKDIHIKKEEVESHLRARMGAILQEVGTEARLEQYLGKSIEVFKDELRKSIREQLILEHMRNLIIDDITMSPQEVKLFFNSLPAAEKPFYPATVEAYHIVRFLHDIPVGKDVLEEVQADVKAGGDFVVLAKKYSQDEATAPNGGELGFWKIGQLDRAYEKAALSLSPGEVSDIIETRFGFHLIQLVERKKDQYNTRHILIKRRTTKQDPKELIKELSNVRTQIIEKKISFEKAVTTYSEDAATIKKSGLLTDGERSIYMPINQLPAELAKLLDPMKPGAISEPNLFITSTGEQAARIIYLKTKVPAHQASLEQDYERIHQLALITKKQKAFEEWLETAKKKVTIQHDSTYVTTLE